jgi:hypothetical protein
MPATQLTPRMLTNARGIMIERPELKALVAPFFAGYDQAVLDEIWRDQSSRFRDFWAMRVMGPIGGLIPDDDCDEYIAILDRNGKGNRKGSEAVAKVMVPQGAWRKLFNEFHSGNRELGKAVDKIFSAHEPIARAAAIDAVYKLNAGARNNLTGASGNAIGAMLAAWEPTKALSMISLKDRRAVIEYLGLEMPYEWDSASTGTLMADTNDVIIAAAQKLGLPPNARTITAFFYTAEAKQLWRQGQQHVVKLPDGVVIVSVPTHEEEEDEPGAAEVDADVGGLRASMQIQALLAKIGAAMGFKIWLPRSDRSRVLKVWEPGPGQLLESLPLAFDATTVATVEQIDVLWLDRRSIVRAFEVEGTTAIYSGLLRMADLVALQPNLKVKLHIVADADRRDKVMREIQRPVFSLLEGGALRDFCTYISYDHVREISENAFLKHTSESVLDEFEEFAEGDGQV